MAATKKVVAVVVKKKVVGTCFVFSSIGPLRCLLCGVLVPVNTRHSCERKE